MTAVIAAMAAGVLADPGDANTEDNGEHGLTWEMSVATGAWWALPDAAGMVDSPNEVGLQSSGDDIENDYEFVLLPELGLGMDINNQRQIVGLDPLLQGGVLIDDGVVTPINVPGAVFTQPTNINERGDIIGFYRLSEESPMVGFHRDRHGEFTTIEYPDPVAESTFLWGLNQPGDIVGFFVSSDDFLSTPFILDRHGEFAILNVPGDGDAVALGINNRGTISGWFLDEDGVSHGYLLEGDGVSVIDFPGALSSDVGRVNNHGEFNGIHFTPPFTIGSYLRSTQGEFYDFSFPGFGSTLIRGINDRGDQCGAAAPDFMSPFQGFVAFRVDD